MTVPEGLIEYRDNGRPATRDPAAAALHAWAARWSSHPDYQQEWTP